MNLTIAITGKGGTGKTTIASLLCRSLINKGVKPLLAVDADANSCLGERLGLIVDQTIGGLRQEVRDAPEDIPAGIPKQDWIKRLVNESVIESKGFDLIAMGRTEGPGCYCSVNNILRDVLDEINRNYKAVIIDNEAGLEHLSRQTDGKVDVMLIVATPSLAGARTAARIKVLIEQMEIEPAQTYLVLNQAPKDLNPKIMKELQEIDLPILAEIPSDRLVCDFEIDGRSLSEIPADSPAATAIDEMVAKLIEKR